MKKIILSLLIMVVYFFPVQIYAAKEKGYDVVTLSKCVDANSARFMLGATEIKVKFIGIDSNDTIYANTYDEINGKMVSDYVCSVLTDAKEIRVEYEVNSEREDKYGRILAWVFVDDVLLQKNLVELGYSKIAYLYDEYKYTSELEASEKVAKENKVGIWIEEKTFLPIDNSGKDVILVKENQNIFTSLLGFVSEIFDMLLKFIDDLIANML